MSAISFFMITPNDTRERNTFVNKCTEHFLTGCYIVVYLLPMPHTVDVNLFKVYE